jgi:hypothetical protein
VVSLGGLGWVQLALDGFNDFKGAGTFRLPFEIALWTAQ